MADGEESASASVGDVPQHHLREVAAVFLRLGFTAFGGPAAHIAMMRREIVERRKWITDARFVDLLGIINLIPGPNSTELAIYLGYLRAGWLGLLLGGVCFIGPAMLIVIALAAAYVASGALPELGWVFYGVQPVVVAIVAQALYGLARTAIKRVVAVIVALAVVALFLLGVTPIAMLFGGGLVYAALLLTQRRLSRASRGPDSSPTTDGKNSPAGLAPVPLAAKGLAGASAAGATAAFSQTTLFLTFLKIGAILYGSGYVLLAFLRSDFVVNLHWLTDRQLLDAVSIGQFTPGPVFTTATFIGYLVGGWQGALLATLAIFLPSFLFVGVISRVAGPLRRWPPTAILLEGVNVAAVALMAGVVLQLGHSALSDALTWALALVSLAILLRFKLNSAWLILAGAVIGLLAKAILRV